MPLLPFLKNKRKETGVIVQERAPDSPEQDSTTPLKAAAQDILSAISMNNSEQLASAIKAAFEICQSYPTDEPSIEE